MMRKQRAPIRTTAKQLTCLVLLALTVWRPAIGQGLPEIAPQVQKQLLAQPGTQALGSASADVTVVEYFDYNCPYCKALSPSFREVVTADPKVAVVFKEWPIFGGVSVYAARAALAAQFQGKYLAAHDALMAAPRLSSNANVDGALAKAGIDLARLQQDKVTHAADLDALLARSDAETQALGIRGTPGLVVGFEVVHNIGDSTALKAAIAAARAQRITR